MADNKMQIFTDQDIIPIINGGTGENTLKDFLKIKDVSETVSVNTITETGIYLNLGLITDLPGNSFGFLVVLKASTVVTQIFYCGSESQLYKIYKRTSGNNGVNWTDWYQIYTSNDIVPINNGGTGEISLDTFMKYKGTIEDADFNNCLTTGSYYVHSDTTTFSNYPEDLTNDTVNHSILIVQDIGKDQAGPSILQILITTNYQAYGDYAKRIYYRLKFLENDFTSWIRMFASNNIIPIANGGTGATERKTAIDNLLYLGSNIIDSTSNDTTAKWVSLGTGYSYFNIAGRLINQPSQYFMVINYISGSDVFQIGRIQDAGSVYYRGGNQKGWGCNWRKLFDDSSTIPVANGGTGATTAANARTNLDAQQKVENVTNLELGSSRSSAGNAYIDFHSNKETDYDARILVGSNKIMQLQSSSGVTVTDMNNGGSYARNIQYSTTDLTAGTSSLTNGRIYLVYE